MYQVTKIQPEISEGRGYRLELMDKCLECRKRLIIKLEKSIRHTTYTQWYGTLQTSSLNPVVYELAPATKLGAFPGYDQVSLKHKD